MSIFALTRGFRPSLKIEATNQARSVSGKLQDLKTWTIVKTVLGAGSSTLHFRRTASRRYFIATSPSLRFDPVQYLTKPSPIVHCCDAGFDMDDYGAIKLAIDSGRLRAILTSLYRPDQKKSAVEAFVKAYVDTQRGTNSTSSRIHQFSLRVFAGYGYYPNPSVTSQENRDRFFSLYPLWPSSIFGDPIVPPTDPRYGCIYPNQLQPFIDNGLVLNPLSGHEELGEFMHFLEGVKEPIVYVCTGPTTNLAEILRQDPGKVKDKVKVIVMMNGTFANPTRMGYNGGLNLRDTKTVLDSGIPCIIVPSALCEGYVFPEELVKQMTANRQSLSQFGKLFHDIMLSWEIHRARKKNPDVYPSKLSLDAPILADPLTMLLAIHPEFIGSVRSIKYTFDLSSNKHLLHPDAATMVKVEEDPNSTVFEVTSITNPEAVQQLLIQKLTTGLTLSPLQKP